MLTADYSNTLLLAMIWYHNLPALIWTAPQVTGKYVNLFSLVHGLVHFDLMYQTEKEETEREDTVNKVAFQAEMKTMRSMKVLQ